MKSFFILMLLIASAAFAWENPSATTAGRFISAPADQVSTLKLEAFRVQGGNERSFRYNLGEKIIIIIPDSSAASRFMRHVRRGSQATHLNVTLTPDSASPFNDRFKAR